MLTRKKSTLAVISKNPIQQAFAGFVRPPEIATAHNAADITNSCSQISHYYNEQVQYLYKKALRRNDRLKAEVDNQQERLSVDAPSETASQVRGSQALLGCSLQLTVYSLAGQSNITKTCSIPAGTGGNLAQENGRTSEAV